MTAGATPRAPGDPIRVLFVCTHNSARSVMAEVLLRALGGERFAAFSAGVEPGGIRPLTLRVLEEAGLPTEGLRSESVLDYLGRSFDHVITVCDNARESCPVFPGGGERHHWSNEDPSAATGTDEERLIVFRRVLAAIRVDVERFITQTAQPS